MNLVSAAPQEAGDERIQVASSDQTQKFEEDSMIQDASAYWDSYYAQRSSLRPMPPSQFSVFVAGEIPDDTETVVDVGCGDGRDSFFFLSSGYRVISVDASAAAIETCDGLLANRHQERAHDAQFIQLPIAQEATERLGELVHGEGRIIVYARFLLHAVDEKTEVEFFSTLEALRKKVALVALEFRTDRDRHQAKATPAHYRRFIRPTDVVERAALAGYELVYYVEGFGMAKYRQDDAHVARILLGPKG